MGNRRLTLILVSAGLAVGLLGATGASAAPATVTVRVTIDKVSAIDCFEGTFLGACLGEADFYAVVSIDGIELPQSSTINDQNNADPDPDWVFERAVDVGRGTVPVSIGIFDEDGGLRLGDDHADIDPTNGGDTSNLDLQVRLAPVCEVSGDAVLTPDQCGTIVTSTGTAANNKARIFFKIEVVDPDTDGDWLPDSWEIAGLDTDGNGTVDVDLPAMGANPTRKDLFLELDCLVAGGSHSHCPVQAAIQAVVQSFADAPVGNPDGSTGIQLHVDLGNLYGQAPGVDTKVLRAGGGPTGSYGNYGGGGDQIDETGNTIVDWDGATGRPATNFYTLKSDNFNTNRALAFRYGIFVHQVNARAASNDCTSGWAEGGVESSGTANPGNDLIVSLGGVRDDGTSCWGTNAASGGNSVGTQNEQAGTLLHEFGHNLALDHGGNDILNDKPNYLGVMNYSFQACQVPTVPGQIPGGCDFSRIALPTLNEVLPPGLDECAGIGLGLGAVNWNGGSLDGTTCSPSSGNVSANVNRDYTDSNNNNTQDAGEPSIFTSLPGFDDWSNIRFDFRAQGNFANGSVPPFPNEATPEIIAASRSFMANLLKPLLSVDKQGPADATPGDTLHYTITLENDGSGPAFNVALADTLPNGSSGFSSTPGTFRLGSTANGNASYVVPCTTTDGTVLTNTATATGRDLLGNTVSGTDVVKTAIHAPVLTVTKTATTTVNAGEAIGYRLTYANTGSGAATSVTVSDTLPAGIYYSPALDLGVGPLPDTITANTDGTTTLQWNIGALAPASGERLIEFTARPTLLALGGTIYENQVSVSYTNSNGCVYAPATAHSQTSISVVAPSANPATIGFWRSHEEEWTPEMLARIQATDQRYDGRDGSSPDGLLSSTEMTAMLGGTGNFPDILERQLLAVYSNLATRRINAGTAVTSKTTKKLGIVNVREAAIYADTTLGLPVTSSTRNRYNDANTVLDEINDNKSEVY